MFEFKQLVIASKGKCKQSGLKNKFFGFTIDSRNVSKGFVFLALKGSNYDGHDYIEQAVNNGAACIIKNKKFKTEIPKKIAVIDVKDTIKSLGYIAAYNRKNFNGPVIVITGSNGKTTTKDMLYSVLSSRFKVLKNEGTKNNHIGVPLALLNLDNSYDIAVLEIGTNHFGEIAYLANICRPNAAIINNIGESHLEHFKTLHGVLKEKYSLVKYFKKPKILVLNADDKFLKNKLVLKEQGVFKISFGIKNKADFNATDIKNLSGEFNFRVNGRLMCLKTVGLHNIYNALAVVAVARVFGLDYSEIYKSFEGFVFPKGRLNLFEYKNITFIDDTYNANPLYLQQAMVALSNIKNKGKKILVMGDMLELGRNSEDFHRCAGINAAGICDYFLTLGNLSVFAAKAAVDSGFKQDKVFSCESCEQIKDILFKKLFLKRDDIVLVKGSRGMKLEKIFE